MSQTENSVQISSAVDSTVSNLSRLDMNHSSETTNSAAASSNAAENTLNAARKSTTFQQIRVHSNIFN